MRLRAWAILVAASFEATGIPLTPPVLGFQQNIGQFSNGVLFALNDFVLYPTQFQLASGVTMRFANSNPFPTITSADPLSYTLNDYRAADPRLWREHIPQFNTVKYWQIYPGVDLECVARSEKSNPFRLIVSAGVDLNQILINVTGATGPFSFGAATAHQMRGTATIEVIVSLRSNGTNSFRPVITSYDPTLPLVIEFGSLYQSSNLSVGAIGADESIFWADYYGPIAKTKADGTPVFLTFLNGSGAVLKPDANGSLTVIGSPPYNAEGVLTSTLPVTPDAPISKAAYYSEGWLGRFRPDGTLQSATYTGGALNAFAADTQGNVYAAIPSSIRKWIPGESKFGFVANIEKVVDLATNDSGEVAFIVTDDDRLQATPGAMKSHYEGPWTGFAGRLDPISGALKMGTYVALIGKSSNYPIRRMQLALAPNGTVWILSEFGVSPVIARTLVAVAWDGSREIDSEAIPYFPLMSFDPDGNLVMATVTDLPNLPTTLDAPLRASCTSPNLYVATKNRDGEVFKATYVKTDPPYYFQGYPGPDASLISARYDAFYIVSTQGPVLAVKKADLTPSANSGIGCSISPASRLPLDHYVAGELVTLVGNGLGPVNGVGAQPDAKGKLPVQVAGIQVFGNGAALPLAAVQQGTITFLVPEDLPPGPFKIEVRSGNTALASASTQVVAEDRFAFLTADGSGSGFVAAINPDGSLNSQAPARSGDVVALYGIGKPPASLFVGNRLARVLYAGPAPELVPGVKQLNIQLPTPTFGPYPALSGQLFFLTYPRYVFLRVQ
jgi:hypothetical protein